MESYASPFDILHDHIPIKKKFALLSTCMGIPPSIYSKSWHPLHGKVFLDQTFSSNFVKLRVRFRMNRIASILIRFNMNVQNLLYSTKAFISKSATCYYLGIYVWTSTLSFHTLVSPKFQIFKANGRE